MSTITRYEYIKVVRIKEKDKLPEIQQPDWQSDHNQIIIIHEY